MNELFLFETVYRESLQYGKLLEELQSWVDLECLLVTIAWAFQLNLL